jgi:hypothetical protein
VTGVTNPEAQILAPPLDPTQPLRVVGPDVELDVGPWVTSVQLEMAMDATTTITVSLGDPENDALLEQADTGGFFQRDKQTGVPRLQKWNTLTLLGSIYVLSVITRTPAGLDLVFYDEVSELLKRFHGPIKISRGRVTRPQFVAGLAQKARVGWLIPDLNLNLPIADLAPVDATALHKTNASPGVKQLAAANQAQQAGLASLRAARITLAGAKDTLSNVQTRAISDALTQADQLQVKDKVRLALVCAGLQESTFDPSKTDYATHTHKGVFQSNQVAQYDTSKQAYHFLTGGNSFLAGGAIALEHTAPALTPGEIAAAVEISGGNGSVYDNWQPVAKKILAAWSPGTSAGTTSPSGGTGSIFDQRTGAVDRAFVQRYEFTVGAQENYWDAARRNADVVRWRRFAIFNHLVFASDYTLADTTPYEVSESDTWFDIDVPWTATRAGKIDQLPIRGRLESILPAGAAVAIIDDNPTYGTWLVNNFQRDLLDPLGSFQATLTRPVKPLPEPASTVKVVSGTAASTSGVPAASKDNKSYVSPFLGGNVIPSRIDEGVDYTVPAGGPIRAIGKAWIESITATSSGWRPWFLIYRLLDGPYADRYVFVAEYFEPVRSLEHQTVAKGTIIGHGTGGGIEMGWGSPTPQQAYAVWRGGGYTEGHTTASGVDFNRLMVALGVPAGHRDPRYSQFPIQGTFP